MLCCFILAHFDIVKQVKFEVSGYLLVNPWKEWSEICHAHICWPPSELIRFWLWSVIFFSFWWHFYLVKQVKFGVSGIFWRTHGRNDFKFGMLLYHKCLQNWLVDSGHGLLIFILAAFWLSEKGQIWGFPAFSWERIREMTWNLASWFILTAFRTD